MCIKKSLNWKSKTQIPEKTSYKINFRPEQPEDISYVNVVKNQIFESVSDIFAKQNKNG